MTTPLVHHKLGRNKSKPGAVGLKLADYVDTKALFPSIPKNFGHADLARTITLGELGNAEWGDCLPAGTGHRHQVSSVIHETPAHFTTADALEFYAAINGHPYPIPGGPGGPNDQGSDMATAAAYERKVGIKDTKGVLHTIDLYAEVEPGNYRDLVVAMYLFDEVGMGIEVQEQQQEQFADHEPWKYVRGGTDEGGHYVTGIGVTDGLIDFVTWGEVAPMEPSFWEHSGDELIAYLDLDNLAAKSSETLEHVDLAGLQKYLTELPKAA